MKNPFQKKSFIILVVVCSLISSLYLQMSDNRKSSQMDRQSLVGQYIKEKGYAPEVKIVKTIIRTIFNIVKTA
ncbi:MAG: hypothetical protein U0T36_03625 [Saprospiraceae bacterium]|jgi:hypothetical protein